MAKSSVNVQNTSYDVIQNIADHLLGRTQIRPKIGIICGSGLGSLADSVSNPEGIEYSTIPKFPVSTVEGHAGRLVFGSIEGKPVVLMQGRFHFYEGYSLDKVTLPVRVMKLMGVEILIVTNAAGGINPNYKLGDIMLLKDHINFPGLAGNSPLRGANEERFGPRFPPLIDSYDKELRITAKKVAQNLGIQKELQEGVYACLGGPNYESIAELRMLHKLGADTVGMSTAHEVVVARHCGMTVFAFSLVTNICSLDYDNRVIANHEEVMAIAKSSQNKCGELVQGLLREISVDSIIKAPAGKAASEAQFVTYETIRSIAEDLKGRTQVRPKVGIICGSGFGELTNLMRNAQPIKYSSIPNFPTCTVDGHKGNLVFGNIECMPVVLMQGRFHFYEGYPLDKVTLPVRVMKLMGVEILIVTNAAGGINPSYNVGDIMLIKDHINWPGFAGLSPLRGPNDSQFGPRFPSVIDSYDKKLLQKAKKVAKKFSITKHVREGIYACHGGPNYQTVAESKLLHKLGADTVGMSTVHEVVVARHCGMTVFGFSLITDKNAIDYGNTGQCNHEEGLKVVKQRLSSCKKLVLGILREIGCGCK